MGNAARKAAKREGAQFVPKVIREPLLGKTSRIVYGSTPASRRAAADAYDAETEAS